jgi:hypothetical protein
VAHCSLADVPPVLPLAYVIAPPRTAIGWFVVAMGWP